MSRARSASLARRAAPALNAHVLDDPNPEDLAHLQFYLDAGVRLSTGPQVPANAEILVAGRPKRQHLTASPSLRALIVPWAGLPDTTRDLLLDFPHLAVHNLHHNAAATAEMAIALLMSAAKFIVPIDGKLRAGDWTPRYQRSQSIGLEGKTALILGYGEIGRRVARVCRALGLNVLATRRQPGSPAPGEADVEVCSPTELHRLLPRADVLVITLPLTPETKGLIGAEEIALLPRGAVLVNVGRGAIVDEGALYHALREGALAAAGLDVWYNYPKDEASRANTPPSKHPFHELDNVVMSPHRGGDAVDIERQRMAHLAKLLNAAARGEPMPNQVDVERGY
jgi:phosphoglycerate dehydrogenase-like enzyme